MSKIITTATPQQSAEIDRIHQWWIDRQTADLTDHQIQSALAPIARQVGLNENVAILDSPLSCLMASVLIFRDQLGDQLRDQLRGQLRDQLWGQLRDQLRGQLGGQLWGQLGDQLRDQLRGQLRDQLRGQLGGQLWGQLWGQLGGQLWGQLGDQLGDQLRDQLRDQLGGQLGDQLRDQLRGQLWDQLRGQLYWSHWCQSISGWLEGGKTLGVVFDKNVYNRCILFCKCVHALLLLKSITFVSRFPDSVCWKLGVLHNDSGPAVRYRDGWSIWCIDGVRVDEQIVLRPQTQTIDQIRSETNNDIRSIRIERYGAGRYLTETGAVVVDERSEPITNTHEALLRDQSGRMYLWPTCPSGRVCPPLGVPEDINTCRDASNWLSSGKADRTVART